MILLLLAALQSGPALPVSTATEQRFNRCIDMATDNPKAAEVEAGRWLLESGGSLARQCLGMAYSNNGKWAAAAAEFEAAARAAEIARNPRSALYWAQSGNAWLAAKDPAKARSALDAAIATGTLSGLDRGEALLDRARAQVASGDLAGARNDIDPALIDAAKDPLAWLLSASLARRMDDLPRARKDIAEALRLSGNDASVQLEAGNIAALDGNEAAAKEAWKQAANIAPDTDAGRNARAALAQFTGYTKP